MTSKRRTRGLCCTWLSAACCLALCGAGASSAADSPWLYGIHWFGPPSNASDVNQLAGGKKLWVLETVMTNDGEGVWGPEGQLANFQFEVSQGHTLIMRVQPVWGKAFPLPTDTAPSMSQFLDQVTHTVTLYKDVCHIWILGNEMNFTFEWGGQALMPENYIDAAVQFSNRVKAVTSSLGPQTVLVGPAATGDQTSSDKFLGWTDYASRMCDRINNTNVRNKFDGFAMHAYGSLDTDMSTILQHFETTPGEGYQAQIGVLDSKGFGAYPIYITEWNRYSGSTAAEYLSATFLYTALARMNAWNQSHHPVVCACWYIYAISDPWWDLYSLLKLKSSGDQDHDVWHAFQYAATFGYPAGSMPAPVIDRSPASFARSVFHGQGLAGDSFTVRNAGADTLTYAITANAAWLTVSPPAGTSAGETDTIAVNYNLSGLGIGTYNAAITIADANAMNSPQVISVMLTIKPMPGDFDHDDDVDQEEFGHLQSCLVGSHIPTPPGCVDADLDGDGDVDASDVAAFARCFAGAAVTPPMNCTY